MAWLRLLLLGVFFSLGAAACGDDDFNSNADGSTTTSPDLSATPHDLTSSTHD